VNSNGSPASGVSVTFTAPGSGASGVFTTSGTATETDTTNSSGVATSSAFTANTTAGGYTVTATAAGMGGTSPAAFTLTNNPGAAAAIQATSGTPQNTVVSTPFTNPLVATVVDSYNNPVPGAGVPITFTAVPNQTGASGLFTSTATGTEIDLTDATGKATSSTFTANATAGEYNVVASFPGLTSANFVLTNTTVVVSANTYVFYLSGQEATNGGPNYYALAGSVTIDSLGDIVSNNNGVGGELDYNDGHGNTSPNEPAADTIAPGTASPTYGLTVNANGQGTLILTDSTDTNVGVGGTITLGVQFVNASHALITQFDGSATSSGSLDLQTATSLIGGGNFAFTLSGVDTGYNPIAIGGVVSIGSGVVTGTFDVNDDGTVFTGQTLTTGAASDPDSFGRGTVTGTQLAGTLAYYVVGSEAVRLISVDTNDAAIGSAFGQGSGAFTNASIGASVLAAAGNPWSTYNAEVGQFTTTNTGSDPASFSGVGEDNELGNGVASDPAAAISGTYTVQDSGVKGYGSLSINSANFGNVTTLGVYMTDPALNLNDPNNTSGGGGALVVDLSEDGSLPGTTGVLVPQTDTATGVFAGNYAVAWQNSNDFTTCQECEFDMVAQGSVTAGALSFTGQVSDPFFTLGTPDATSSGNTFTGNPLADSTNPGRYSMLSTNTIPNPLAAAIDGASGTFDLVLYQASGGQLFWLEYDGNSVFLGPLQQQNLTGIPATKDPAAKSAQPKQ
jgi:hypothetical protein